MSRLRQQMQRIAEQQQARRGPTENVQEQLGKMGGDAFELAARCALESASARPRRDDESDVFRLGYLTAAKEIAVVLRCMRAGTMPTPEMMAEARNEAVVESEVKLAGDTTPEPVCPHCGGDIREVLTTSPPKCRHCHGRLPR